MPDFKLPQRAAAAHTDQPDDVVPVVSPRASRLVPAVAGAGAAYNRFDGMLYLIHFVCVHVEHLHCFFQRGETMESPWERAKGTLSGPLDKPLAELPREGERFTIRGLRVPGAGEVDVSAGICMLSEPLSPTVSMPSTSGSRYVVRAPGSGFLQ